VLFAILIIPVPAGERQNWPVIRSWAATLATSLMVDEKKTTEVT
jgi:hypothetical protein